MGSLGPGEILLFVVVILFLFGAKRIPEFFRSLGQATNEFKKGQREGTVEAAPIEGPCPFCGVEIPSDAKFCPGCAKDASEVVAERSKQDSRSS